MTLLASEAMVEEVVKSLRFQDELGLNGEFQTPNLISGHLPTSPRVESMAKPEWGTSKTAKEFSSMGVLPNSMKVSDERLASRQLRDRCGELHGAEALSEIRNLLGDCRRCKLSAHRTHLVFGVGSPTADLMFIGEGPRRDEDLQGEPFVGKVGKLLDRMIVAMGLKRLDVYIANVVKCRPPKNGDPEREEVLSCEPYLKAQIQAVQPKVVVVMGSAAQTLLQTNTPISRLRGRWAEYEGIALMPTFHPAYLLCNPAQKKPVWTDLQAVMAKLNLPVPS